MDRKNTSEFGKNWNRILKAIGNETKRAIVAHIGRSGKSKGGNDELVKPVVELSARYGIKLNPFSVPPKLSELKNKDGLVKLGEDGYWTLTEDGQKAYDLLLHIVKTI